MIFFRRTNEDRRKNEELRRMVGVEPITIAIRSGRLRWYGHVMRKHDEDWVKKCMECRVEGRSQMIGWKTKKTELEIDKKDVHDRKKWRRNVM